MLLHDGINVRVHELERIKCVLILTVENRTF